LEGQDHPAVVVVLKAEFADVLSGRPGWPLSSLLLNRAIELVLEILCPLACC
jgi:hypothetical protein